MLPLSVLKRGSGSCSEYSFVMIAMLRAAGIPARYAGSVVIRGDDASRDDVSIDGWKHTFLHLVGFPLILQVGIPMSLQRRLSALVLLKQIPDNYPQWRKQQIS